MDNKLEVVYYELVKMEDRLTQKAELILKAESNIKESLERFELMQRDFFNKLEALKK